MRLLIKGVPRHIKGVRLLIKGVPRHIKGVRLLIKGVPRHIKGVCLLIKGVPRHIKGVALRFVLLAAPYALTATTVTQISTATHGTMVDASSLLGDADFVTPVKCVKGIT